jgi:2-dehydropantoate 2-reductase
VPLWEKFAYLAPFAGLTGAARLPIGPLRERPGSLAILERGVAEVEALARAEGVAVAADLRQRIRAYVDALPPTTRSSLLIDLSSGKRIEVEALQGAVVRRAAARGLDVPVMATLYAALAPHA